jgi:hypothetical protein
MVFPPIAHRQYIQLSVPGTGNKYSLTVQNNEPIQIFSIKVNVIYCACAI